MGRGTHCDLTVGHHAAAATHLRSGAVRLVLRLPREPGHSADAAEQHLQRHERGGGIRACLPHVGGGLSLAGRAGHHATVGDASKLTDPGSMTINVTFTSLIDDVTFALHFALTGHSP